MRRPHASWLAAFVLAVPGSAWAQPGPPHSIELVVVSDVAQDIVHVQRAPGAPPVTVKPVIRDAQGNVLGQPVAGCTPIFQVQNTLGRTQGILGAANPDGTRDIGMGADTGVFSVSVHCQENPAITSEGGHHAPFNFEVSKSPFAPGGKSVAVRVAEMKAAMAAAAASPAPAPPSPPPASTPTPSQPASDGGSKKKMGMGGILLGGALGYLGYQALAGSSSGPSCPTSSDLAGYSNVCIPDNCDCPSGFVSTGLDYTRCTREGNHRMCARTSANALERPPADVVRPGLDVRAAPAPVSRGPVWLQPRPLVVGRAVAVDRPLPCAASRPPAPAHTRPVPRAPATPRVSPATPAAAFAARRPISAAPRLPAARLPAAESGRPAAVARAPTAPAARDDLSRIARGLAAATVSIVISRTRLSIRRHLAIAPWVEPDAGGFSFAGWF